jgi:hypothetical protein
MAQINADENSKYDLINYRFFISALICAICGSISFNNPVRIPGVSPLETGGRPSGAADPVRTPGEAKRR